MRRPIRPLSGTALALATSVWLVIAAPLGAQQPALADAEFWRLITDLSETGGRFPRQWMSNEDSAQFVMPALQNAVRPGGVYVGVGSEQNFTYLAALRPRLAFVVDIRRENVVDMLTYKALFEVSSDRAEFVSRLFSRPRPNGLLATSSVDAIFDAFAAGTVDVTMTERTASALLEVLGGAHKFPLSDEDTAEMRGMLDAFRTAGPGGLKGYGDRTNPTFAQLMAAPDSAGQQEGFLASEDRFAAVRDLQRRNLIVPVTGDFAGDKALAGIARELRARNAVVSVFYVSNVERYLWEQGDHGQQFYRNVSAMPLDDASVFVRSVTSDISVRLGIPIPAGPEKWRTFLFSMRECLARLADGRIKTYADLFAR